jgi:membrane protease YdiL (CAAX protease family)
MAVAIEGGLAALALPLAWLFGVPLRSQFPTTGAGFARALVVGILATLPLLAMFWWLVHASWSAATRLREQVEQLIADLFPQASFFELALVSVVAGVSEELLFRGVAQVVVARWTTPLAGIIIVSCVFGLFHAVTLLYFALAALVGAYFGWLVLEYGDLLAPIVTHGLYDFLALAYLSRQIDARLLATSTAALPTTSEREE